MYLQLAITGCTVVYVCNSTLWKTEEEELQKGAASRRDVIEVVLSKTERRELSPQASVCKRLFEGT